MLIESVHQIVERIINGFYAEIYVHTSSMNDDADIFADIEISTIAINK